MSKMSNPVYLPIKTKSARKYAVMDMLQSGEKNCSMIMKDGCVATGVPIYPPFLSFNGTAFSGVYIAFFELLMKKLGLCYTYIRSPEGYSGYLNKNGSWDGVVGLVERREAELIVALALTSQRFQVLDYAATFSVSNTAIIYPRPKFETNYLSFLVPFTLGTWLTVCGALLFILVITIIIQKVILETNKFQNKHENTLREKNLNIMWTYIVLLSQRLEGVPEITMVRLIVTCWLLFSLIIGIIYRSTLAAILISPKVPIPFNNLEELVRQETFKWAFMEGALAASSFKIAYDIDPDSVYGKVWKFRSDTYSSPIQVASYLLDKNMACIDSTRVTTSLMSEDFAKTRQCRFVQSRDVFIPTTISIAARKGSPILKMMDPIILQMREYGMLDKMGLQAATNATFCKSAYFGKNQMLRALKIEDLLGIFCILIAGWIISLIVFVTEVLLKSRRKKASLQWATCRKVTVME